MDAALVDTSTHEYAAKDRRGLSSEEAAERLARYGPNEPEAAKRRSMFAEILAIAANPLVLILLAASAVTAFAGEVVNAAIITAIVLFGGALDFAQTYRSQRAVEMLRARIAPTATALRDGVWKEIERRDVTVGDLVKLVAGDLVPADGELLDARDLHAQEAMLTGESMPVEKEIGPERERREVYFGTSIVSGTAIARVRAIGRATKLGDVVARLAARPPKTAFEQGLLAFGGLILKTVLSLVLALLVIGIGLHRDPLETLLFAVALAVGLTPEFLPMITSVTLARGAVRMAKSRVIVKHLAAIQNLGGIDVLCSDKTGTLTRGEMTVARATDLEGRASVDVRRLAYLNSKHETGIRSPLDVAILREGAPDADADSWKKLDEVPFDFERRRVSIVVGRDGERLLIAKGAPEPILDLATSYLRDGAAVALDEAARARVREDLDALGREGLRAIAVASRVVAPSSAYTRDDEHDLVLAGLVAFADPPREDAAATVAALERDGVAVKILTGDGAEVAAHVCRQVGLDGDAVVLGSDIAGMTDSALAHVAEQASVFARVSPAQKQRILLALKSRGHVVGFLGDGINDAPSLHTADVGISVASAVDVARDAADVILLESGLAVLHEGIVEGRKAFGNVMKYLFMGTSSNFGNMFSMAAAALFLPFLPMLPIQILLNNLLYDLAQVTIPSDAVDPSVLTSPQRWDVKRVRDFMVIVGPVSSIYDFLTFAVMRFAFHADERLFRTGWFVESLLTQTLVLFVIRTSDRPWRSRPSGPLAATTIAVAAVAVALPFSPVARWFEFVAPPPAFFVFLALATATYLGLVEIVKHRLVRAR